MATIRGYADPPEHPSGTVTNLSVVHSGDLTRDEKAAAYDRLRSVNAELLAAARGVIDIYESSRGEVYGEDIRRLQEAIAKASEVTP